MSTVRPFKSGWLEAITRAFIPLVVGSRMVSTSDRWQREDFIERSCSRRARLYMYYCRSAAYRID